MGRSYGFETAQMKPDSSPELKDIYYLAGFIEGEGSMRSRPGSPVPSIIVNASQVHRCPLDKIRSTFGGKVYGPYKGRKKTENDYYLWSAHGPRAVGILQTLYPLLSQRRQTQITTILSSLREKETI